MVKVILRINNLGFVMGKYLIALSVFMLTCHSWANDKDLLFNCKINKSDMFDRVERVSSGPYKGRCINTKNYRSVRMMNYSQLKSFSLNKSSQNFHVANFRHLDRFWVAEIPHKSIIQTDFQMVPLSDALPMYHGQLRFRFKPGAKPIKLISQEKNLNNRRILYLKNNDGSAQDFIVALFGARDIAHDKQAFNPLMGISLVGKSKYAISYAFQSLYDGAQWALGDDKTMKQYRLKISKEDTYKLLEITRGTGDKNQMNDMYNLLVNNCLNFVFKALAQTIDYKKSLHVFRRLSQTFGPVSALKKMGLIESKEYVTLRSEFPNDIEKVEDTIPFLD
jgi:hypothetical protein